MVPGQHPVVHAEHHVGQRQVVVTRRRQPLEHASPVVGEIARRPALERRQIRHGRRPRAARAACERRPSASPATITLVAGRVDRALRSVAPCSARSRPDRRSGTNTVPASRAPRCRETDGMAARRAARSTPPGRAVARAPRRAGARDRHAPEPPAEPRPTSRASRRDRCVSRTCLVAASSGGVRYPQERAASCR